MDQIDEIISDVLRAEGWDRYTNHPADRGGPTKWGITLRAWSNFLGQEMTPADIKAIPEQGARDFYRQKYILEPKFDQLPQQLIAMVVDCGVNHGTIRVAKWLQQALGVPQDGIIGPVTIAAAHKQNWWETYLEICAYRIQLYGRLVTDDPSQSVFAAGWNNRASKWLLLLAGYLAAVSK